MLYANVRSVESTIKSSRRRVFLTPCEVASFQMAKKFYIEIYTLLLILLVLINTGYSIRCYQCNSTSNEQPFQCNEFLTSDMDLEPESCDDVYGAQYCVKHIGRFEGGIGTKRFCSAVHMGNYCDYVKQPGDKLTYRTCVFTCSGDGCNPATSFVPNIIYTWVMPVGLLVAWKKLFYR